MGESKGDGWRRALIRRSMQPRVYKGISLPGKMQEVGDGGEGGIRTREELEAPTRFPVAPVRPLRHLSARNGDEQRKNVRAYIGRELV